MVNASLLSEARRTSRRTAVPIAVSTLVTMPMGALACWFGWWRRQRRQTGQGEQEYIRGIEEVQVSVDRTVRRCEEDCGATRVIDGDVGLETGAAARFFKDVRRRVRWQD